MKLVLALGNPGDRYRDTRHNAGWWLADRLARGWGFASYEHDPPTAWTGGRVGEEAVEVHKPLTYMNRAGVALAKLRERRSFDPLSDMLVLVDDVWLPPGRIRLRRGGSPGGHNGLASLGEALASEEFARLRVGVGRPDDDRIDLAEWVLAPMPRAEEERVLAAFARASETVEDWVKEGTEAAMNRLGAREAKL